MMTQTIQMIPASQIRAGANDRTVFNREDLDNLSASIRFHGKGIHGKGLLQPITIRKVEKHFEIIAGERRFRACTLLGWKKIPSIVVQVTDEEAAALMLVENISRRDLDPIDEARAYKIRIERFEWTLEECAEQAGVSVIKIQYRLKLLNLRDDLQSLVRTGNLMLGYAQILSDACLDPNRQLLAVKALQANPKPSPGWFRNIVNQYREQQLQAGLFDTSAFLVCQEMPAIKTEVTDPPHPSTTTPPINGSNPAEIIHNQILFWNEASQEWDRIGKPFKKQECQAASQALSYLLTI